VSQLVTYLGRQDLVFVVWFEIAALYFVLTFIVSRVLLAVERRYRVPGLEAAQL
jgi:ABC-type amino acid transport system permease subunit